MDDLLPRLTHVLGGSPQAARVAQDLLDRYREPHRAYHDERHLSEVLHALDLLDVPGEPGPVRWAACWHDAVYEPRAADNEELSAALAAQALPRLGAAPAPVAEVVRLVRLTATHAPRPGDDAGALLCDADLAVLAAAPERYAGYAAGVRAEYAHLDDGAFRAGRAALLRTFLGRQRLYATASGRRRWEDAARRNLAAELRRLSEDEDDAGPRR